jgi:glycosyltransferase involved in cell wall biosynthesis/uncharacterized protein YjbI with pentapeptide repeats
MLASLLPGLRELRAPLAAGYLWLLSAFLLIAPHIPEESDASGIAKDLYSLRDAATAIGLGVAVSFVAFLIGTLSTGVLNPLLRSAPARIRRPRRRAAARPDRFSDRSWLALRGLVVDSLREVDAAIAETPVTVAGLVRDEVPTARQGSRGLVGRILDAVANELDLVKTRLLGKEADLFSAADRHQAEADFRLAVIPPLLVLSVVIAVLAGVSWISLVAVALAIPVISGLWRQAFAADTAAAEVLVDALRLRRVESPTLERLASAARRTASLPADAPLPAPRERRAVVDGVVEDIRTAASWARPLADGQITEEARMEMRLASDSLDLLEVYLPEAPHLEERARRVQRLLQAGRLSEAEVTELDEAADVISELSLADLERPGELEELVADEKALRAALESTDPERQRAAALALPEALGQSESLRALLEIFAETTRTAEPAAWLRRAFESLARRYPVTIVSWQGAKLAGANLAGLPLTGIDLRDADLTGAVLSNANMLGARLHNASLVGAKMDHASLVQAELVYTDLARADLTSASLVSAAIEAPLVQGVTLREADLTGASFDPASIPWYLTEGWETAILDPVAHETAEAIGGRTPSGPKILMLSWEAPPLVAGGSWTACWHLVRSLRSHGADITVVVPWAEHLCEPRPFGTDVEVVFAGIEPSIPTPYVTAGGPFPPYLPYSAFSPYWWGVGADVATPYFGGGYSGAARRAVDEFAAWFEGWDRAREFAVVHAHDWVTFRAAERSPGVPWVAHFHSTVADRRPGSMDVLGSDYERKIERDAMYSAAAVVAPSKATEDVLALEYGAKGVHVVPNALAREAPPPRRLGMASGGRVVFVGRMARQKAPDRFLEIARWENFPGEFVAFGDGEERARLEAEAGASVTFEGAVPWPERDRAFEGASVVVVPSRSEPFGMVIAEAMQRGVPVVYTKDAGIAEVVDAGVPYDAENSGDAHEAIERLVAEPAWWARVADEEVEEISLYAKAQHELELRDLWHELAVPRQRASRL